jgi:hypothetical protein
MLWRWELVAIARRSKHHAPHRNITIMLAAHAMQKESEGFLLPRARRQRAHGPHSFKLKTQRIIMLNSIRLQSCIYHEDSAIDMLALGGPIVPCTWD